MCILKQKCSPKHNSNGRINFKKEKFSETSYRLDQKWAEIQKHTQADRERMAQAHRRNFPMRLAAVVIYIDLEMISNTRK